MVLTHLKLNPHPSPKDALSIYFHYYPPFEKGMAFHLRKHSLPSPKYALCQVWVKLALWFLRRRFLKFINAFSLFRYYLPLEKGGVLHLNKLESPSHKDALCQVLVEIGLLVLEKKMKM